jgi:hypothetical protein
MSATKENLMKEQEFANQEIGAIEHTQGYFFDDIKHIHMLDGKPLIGTSSMASVLSKPLTWWASGLAVAKLGWIHKGDKIKGWTSMDDRLESSTKMQNKISKMSPEEYLDLLDEAYKAHSVKLNDSAEAGTNMHAVMECYVKDCIDKNEGKPIKDYQSSYINVSDSNKEKLQILVDWSITKVKRFIASEVNTYSEKLWIGGIVDCVFEDVDGKYAILDFKSSKEVYLSQFWQCCGYAIQLEETGGFTPKGIKVLTLDKPIDYVCVLPFGMKKPDVQYNVDVAGGKEAVSAMLTLYKKLN